MLFSLILALVALAFQARALTIKSRSPSIPKFASTSAAVAEAQLAILANIALQNAKNSVQNPNCKTKNMRVRRDWRAFTSAQKKAYIKSLICLQTLPSQTPSKLVPGARTRYDDFVATHINQSMYIHFSGVFLAWHRYFIYNFESALRDECGYTGDYPYWVWAADAGAMEKSQIFDGSDTSISGNGAYIANRPDIVFSLGTGISPPILLPPGSGGGCVISGPFKNYKINLGPQELALPGNRTGTAADPFEYNPRCLKRDLTTGILQKWGNYTSIVDLILANNDIWDFEMTMQGKPGTGNIGIHNAGHYSMGGDPGRDFFVSPGDPAFWLHHGGIDRTWWIWQNLDLKNRQNAISGTGFYLNLEASANTTLNTVIDVGYSNKGPIAMHDLTSTTGGPFCYVYV